MYPRTIANIEGEDIIEHANGSVQWTSKMTIDSDGIGPHHGDKTAQDDTSLHYQGRPLNADEDRYIVVPPAIRDGVQGIVLGCRAVVFYKDKQTEAVVGDIGPKHKLGEASCACALVLGINPSPVSGGVDKHEVRYMIFPGRPAVVDGKKYELQAKR
jgi:hypothetical protein